LGHRDLAVLAKKNIFFFWISADLDFGIKRTFIGELQIIFQYVSRFFVYFD
jgi:hypothetical protein